MKLILLAAAVAFAVPAMAQTTDTSTPAQDQSGMAADSATPAGGYQPAAPPLSGPVPAGATVVFQPSQSPTEAYPPPPAMAHYPMCKSGQTEGCMERENAQHQGLHPQHRH
jgi:hypothetical protein